MKILSALFLFSYSALALSQTSRISVQQDFLADQDRIGTFQVSTQQASLDESLSADLRSKVLRSSGLYAISNMSDIQLLVNAEKSKSYPDLKLAMNSFNDSDPLNISISRIDTLKDRDILRGQVDGYAYSQVKLVVYNGQMTGRISLSQDPKVLVIRSINGGISANYEIDTSDITFD